ncbi:hypothetical protein N7528_006859 [Penicillium herquei]|nr:hypothetical protein N7528_006859 [Penicillium herquei]
MDHLVSLFGPTEREALFQIPYVAQEFDQEEFMGYGRRRGFGHVSELLQLCEEDERSFTSLIQTWLYFGLLWEVFGPSCRSEDFIELSQTGNFISTKRLVGYCEEWLSGPSHREAEKSLDSLEFATSLIDRLDEELQGTRLSEASFVIFSIKILIDTLAVVMNTGISYTRNLEYSKTVIRKPAVSQFLVHYLLDRGWCPARLAHSSFWLHSDSLYLLTALEPSVLIGENHQNCSRGSCRVDNLSDYSPQHTASCTRNECLLLHTPSQKLLSICRTEQVPILSCNVTSSGVSEIDVIPSSQCPSFVAISHVWSDGLGNDEANAVYKCQITELANQVYRRQSFLDDEFDESERPDMPADGDQTVFFGLTQSAGAVLVRDNILRDLSLPYDMPPLHLAIRMHWMKWLTRCWTLAECLDRLLEYLSHNKPLLCDPRTPPAYHDIASSAIQSDLLSIFEIFDFAKQGESNFSSTWNSILHRSTSKIQDVPGILSIVNAISIRDIVQLPQEQRLRAVINTFRKIPAALLFNTGQKCQDEAKNRWVPSQVLGADLMTQKPTLTTYLEGRMLGPLHPHDFQFFTFRGTDLNSFDIKIQTSRTFLEFHVRMLDSFERQPPEQDWCIVLPKDFVDEGFLATSSCKAFCATVQKKSINPFDFDGETKRPSLLVRWETLAQVTVWPYPTASSVVVYPNAHLGDLYVECDMATWPSPTALASFLTRRQTEQMDSKVSKTGSVVGLLVALGLMVGFAILTNDNHTSDSVKIGVGAVLVFFLLAMFIFALGKVSGPILFEADWRTQEDWKQLFIDLNSCARGSLRFRFVHWLRDLYDPHASWTSRDTHTEVESHDLIRHASKSISWVCVVRKLTKMPLPDFLLACRMLLCVAEFGVLCHINYLLWEWNIRGLTVILTCFPVGVSLVIIPFHWVDLNMHSNQEGHQAKLGLVRMVQVAIWLTCTGLIIFVSRQSQMEFHRSIGNVAAALAGLQVLIIAVEFVHEQLLWLPSPFQFLVLAFVYMESLSIGI